MTADPWALLREARESVKFHLSVSGWAGNQTFAIQERLARMDAALVRHDAMKSEDANVEWKERETNRYGVHPQDADYSDDIFLTVEPHWLATDKWLWRVEYVGAAKNETEAKAAAIEYAGRLP